MLPTLALLSLLLATASAASLAVPHTPLHTLTPHVARQQALAAAASVELALPPSLAEYPPYDPAAVKAKLYAFYYALGGPQWYNAAGWDQPESDPCCYFIVPISGGCQPWFGVLCIDLAVINKTLSGTVVTGVFFNENRLVGTLTADAICDISPYVSSIVIVSGNVNGSVPDCLANYHFLQGLYLASLDLDPAPLPAWLGEVATLNTISVADNQYYGPIPDGWATLPLSIIDVSGNTGVNGTLPSWLDDLEYLNIFTVRSTSMSGTIPAGLISSSPYLAVLDLSQCNFEGTIPDAFLPLSNLSTFDVSFNRLTGSLPPSIALAVTASPINVTVTENFLSGVLDNLFVPGSLAVNLDLSANNFAGPLPPGIAHATNLTTLLLRSNKLNGTIPASLGALHKLETLDLGENEFTDVDPAWKIYKQPQLTFLSLRANDLCRPPALFYLNATVDPNSFAPQSCRWVSPLSFVDISDNPFSVTCAHLHTGPGAAASVPAAPHELLASLPRDVAAAAAPFFATRTGTRADGSSAFSLNEFFAYLIASNIGSSSALVTCIIAENVRNRVLQTLVMSGIGLTGELPTLLFSAFPSLTQIDVSRNNLTGSLPAVSLIYPFYLPLPLSYADLSDNQLTGDIPLVWGLALLSNLRYLNLELNNLRSTAPPPTALPSFLVPDWESRRDVSINHYFCPGLRSSSGAALVVVNTTYYRRALCRCSERFYGAVNPAGEGCSPIVSYCSDGRECAAQSLTRKSPSSLYAPLVPAVGYWPAPSLNHTVAFVPCSIVPVQADAVACNPDGALTCLPSPDTANALVCFPESAVCARGAHGKMCSECSRGFYRSPDGCVACPIEYQSIATYVISFSAAAVAMVIGLSLRSQETSVKRRKLRSQFHLSPSASSFFTAYWPDLALMAGFWLAIAVTLVPYSFEVPGVLFIIVLVLYFSLYSMVRRALPTDLHSQLARARENVGGTTQPLLGSLNSASPLADVASYFPSATARATSVLPSDAEPMGGFFGDTTVGDVRQALAVAQSIFKSFLVFFQLIEAITYRVIVFPTQYAFITEFNEFIFAALRVACKNTGVNFVVAYKVVMYFPLVSAIVFVFARVVAHVLARVARLRALRAARGTVDVDLRSAVANAVYHARLRSSRASLSAAAVTIGYIVYFPVTRAYVAIFACNLDPLPGAKSFYVSAAPSILCWESSEWWSMFITGTTLFLVYSVAFFYALARVGKLSRAHALGTAAAAPYSILFESYRPSKASFEIRLTIRRLAIAFLASSYAITSAFAPFLVVAVLVASLASHGWHAPFISPLGNFMEMVSLCTLLVVYVLARSLLRLFEASATVSYTELNGDAAVINNLAVSITGTTLLAFFAIGILPFIRLIPVVRRRNLRVFRVLGLGAGNALSGGYGSTLSGATSDGADASGGGDGGASTDPMATSAELDDARATIARLSRRIDQQEAAMAGLRIQHEAELAAVRASPAP